MHQWPISYQLLSRPYWSKHALFQDNVLVIPATIFFRHDLPILTTSSLSEQPLNPAKLMLDDRRPVVKVSNGIRNYTVRMSRGLLLRVDRGVQNSWLSLLDSASSPCSWSEIAGADTRGVAGMLPAAGSSGRLFGPLIDTHDRMSTPARRENVAARLVHMPIENLAWYLSFLLRRSTVAWVIVSNHV